MASYLDEIVRYHRRRATEEPRSGSMQSLEAAAAEGPPVRPFLNTLSSGGAIRLIAEIKRRSPSKGSLAEGLDPAATARSYEKGGASCLSVLTDGPHFGGSRDDLEAARASCELPVLRKDFTVCEADVLEARAMGADAILLIAAALSREELQSFQKLARSLGMASLVEVHDEAELEQALAIGASLVGVNQRDLRTFQVDTGRAIRLGAQIPEGVVKVAESGIRHRGDVATLQQAGFHAVLVGESIVTAGDPASAVAELLGAGGALVRAGEEEGLRCS